MNADGHQATGAPVPDDGLVDLSDLVRRELFRAVVDVEDGRRVAVALFQLDEIFLKAFQRADIGVADALSAEDARTAAAGQAGNEGKHGLGGCGGVRIGGLHRGWSGAAICGAGHGRTPQTAREQPGCTVPQA